MHKLLLAALLLFCAGPALAAPNVANQTVMTFDPGHGTQVEYVAANGTNYLWYPGNRIVLPGRWKIEGANICFAYGANTYNPVTGQHGGAFECETQKDYRAGIVERTKGDIFGLSKRTAVPFALPPRRTTFAALARLVGPVPRR